MELHRGAWRKITPQRHTQLIVFQPRKITTKTAYVYLLYALIQLNVCFINSTSTVIATRGVTSGWCTCRLKTKIRELVILNSSACLTAIKIPLFAVDHQAQHAI